MTIVNRVVSYRSINIFRDVRIRFLVPYGLRVRPHSGFYEILPPWNVLHLLALKQNSGTMADELIRDSKDLQGRYGRLDVQGERSNNPAPSTQAFGKQTSSCLDGRVAKFVTSSY
jgi:hypothetical protein